MTPYSEHTVTYTANGDKSIYYIAAGPPDGPLLIFLHGWPGIAKTWMPQLETFSSLGFRVVAPDMPGYGNSTVTRVIEDYSHETIISGLLALLTDVGKDDAIWIGHDWGAGVLSSFVATHPQACKAIVLMCVPYRTIELGLEELVKYVNRDVYPAEKYPYGQWEYMKFYEESFERATAFFDADPGGFLRALARKAITAHHSRPAMTATVLQDGGWFGGIPNPPPEFHRVPAADLVLSPELYEELVAAMKKTGFWAGDAYYMNHARNRAYNIKHTVNNGVLDIPVLFIEAKNDTVCDTYDSRLAEPMRKYCTRLTEDSIDAGHWVAMEKSAETNAAMTRWLVEEVANSWR